MTSELKNTPVYFVIVQVRFNPILEWSPYIPQIQEKLRRQGFPDFKTDVLPTIDVNKLAETGRQQLSFKASSRYVLSDIDQISRFVLNETFLSFHTTVYDGFEPFLEKFITGLQAVHEVVELNYTERIGLRYLHAVFPHAEKPLSDYLKNFMLGLAEKVDDGKTVYTFSETLLDMNLVNILVRTIIQDGQIAFPPDLAFSASSLAEQFRELTGRHAILDMDGSIDSRESFNLKGITEHLKNINHEIEKVFYAAVTDTALESWR